MGVLDLDRLLREISPEAPSGDNLEYDPVFGQMERAAEGRPEKEIGETFVEATEADWHEVRSRALDVLSRSHDLRAALYLARAALHTDGFLGFSDGLAIVREYVGRFWESLHPQLDPDDDNDPTMRINALVALRDSEATLQPVREAPLVVSRVLGRFTYRDVQVAAGELPPRGDESPPEMSTILAAFRDYDLAELTAVADAVEASAESVARIEEIVTEWVGPGQAPDLGDLTGLLGHIDRFLKEQLERRGISSRAESVPEESPALSANDQTPTSPPVAADVDGGIRSREDVIRMIDRVCDYYRQHEPCSPIPLLLNRAKRLVHKNFLEILEDLAPDGLSEFHQKWCGPTTSEDGVASADHEEVRSQGEPVESDGWG